MLDGTFGVASPVAGRSLNSWWDDTLSGLPKARRRAASRVLIYAMWGTWKERNRRVFQNVALLPDAVAMLVREEIAQRAYAHSTDPGDLHGGS